jgi:hypothetical protein
LVDLVERWNLLVAMVEVARKVKAEASQFVAVSGTSVAAFLFMLDNQSALARLVVTCLLYLGLLWMVLAASWLC